MLHYVRNTKLKDLWEDVYEPLIFLFEVEDGEVTQSFLSGKDLCLSLFSAVRCCFPFTENSDDAKYECWLNKMTWKKRAKKD